MTITNGYCTLDDVTAALRMGNDTNDDAAIERAVEAASRLIDGYCSRHFYADTVSARVFRATNCNIVDVDDISTLTGLVVATDSSGDGTFDVTWSASDYQLEPLNGRRSGQAWPYHTLRAVGSYDFPTYGTRGHEALVEVTAAWGWAAIPAAVVDACVIQTVSQFKAKDAPLGFAGFGDMGAMRMSATMHPTARTLLAPYRKHAVKVA